jgi:hypothetical protein
MKKAFLVTCMFVLSLSFSYAQNTEYIKFTGQDYSHFVAKNEFKYPVFTKASIAFTDGNVASARINYNNFTQKMFYIDEKKDTLEIANPQDISYIAIGEDSIFHDNGYYQWVASSGSARLAVKLKYKEAFRALVGAFGSASPARHVVSHDKVFVDGISTQPLSANEEITIAKEITYYISPINDKKNNFVLATKKNIDKLFPKKKVEDFIKDNKLNLNKEADLIDLMVHISKPK